MSDIKNIIEKKWKYFKGLPFISGLFTPSEKIAVIKMSGIIAEGGMHKKSINFAKYSPLIEKAFEKRGLKAVAFIINSPGGSPAQSMLIGNFIRKKAKEKNIPVYAFVEDVAASGGYWIACAADEIYALPVSIVGSIGVISSGFGMEDFIKKYDIKRRVYTAGKQKSFLDMFSEEKESDVKRLENTLTDLHGIFKGWVKERRGHKIKGDDKDLFEGQFWIANEVTETGLIDGLGDFHSVIEDKFGKDIDIQEVESKKSFLPFSGAGVSVANANMDGLVESVFTKVEEKSIYSRYGF